MFANRRHLTGWATNLLSITSRARLAAALILLALGAVRPPGFEGVFNSAAQEESLGRFVLTRDKFLLIVIAEPTADKTAVIAKVGDCALTGIDTCMVIGENADVITAAAERDESLKPFQIHFVPVKYDGLRDDTPVVLLEWRVAYLDPTDTKEARLFLNGEFLGKGLEGVRRFRTKLDETHDGLVIIRGMPNMNSGSEVRHWPFDLDEMRQIAAANESGFIALDEITGQPVCEHAR
jgi:hypothetical protein